MDLGNPYSFDFANKDPPLILLYDNINAEFNNCDFHGNNLEQILQTYGKILNPINVVVRNTNYTATILPSTYFSTSVNMGFISLSHTTLILVDSVMFHDMTFGSVIYLKGNSTVIIHGTVEFSLNDVNNLIYFHDNIQYMIIKENSILNISNNKVWSLFDTYLPTTKYPYPFCLFQYYINSKNEVRMENRKFLIQFYKNKCKLKGCYKNITIANCQWVSKSLFKNSSITPMEVNNHYM